MAYQGYKGYGHASAGNEVAEALMANAAPIQPQAPGNPNAMGDTANRYRAYADMLQQGIGDTSSKSLSEGIAQMGKAWMSRGADKRASEAEAEYGKAQANSRDAMVQALLGSDADPQMQAAAGALGPEKIAEALLAQSMPSYADQTGRMGHEHKVQTDDRDFNYGVQRDGVADANQEREFNYGVSRDGVADDKWLVDFERGAMESDRNYGLGVASHNLQQQKFNNEADPSGMNYSSGEIKAMREKGEQLQAFQASLSAYTDLVAEEGVRGLDVTGRDKRSAQLDAMRQDLMFQGKNLWELGVLSKDDYDNMAKAIPDATGAGAWWSGKDVFAEKAQPLQDSITRQLDRLPEQYRSYVPDQTAPEQQAPPQAAIDRLMQEPHLAEAFDKKYGPGAAQMALGGR